MSDSLLVVKRENDFLAGDVETFAAADTRHQHSIIVSDVLCANAELNGHTICLDSCDIERRIVKRAGDVLCDAQSHNAGVALCVVLRSAEAVTHEAGCAPCAAVERENVSVALNRLVGIVVAA